jgi:hypothetical protein
VLVPSADELQVNFPIKLILSPLRVQGGLAMRTHIRFLQRCRCADLVLFQGINNPGLAERRSKRDRRVTCHTASSSPVAPSGRPFQPGLSHPPRHLSKPTFPNSALFATFLYTALTCWILAFIWTVWLLGGVSSTFVAPFYPYTHDGCFASYCHPKGLLT